jgi:hypothetical protein
MVFHVFNTLKRDSLPAAPDSQRKTSSPWSRNSDLKSAVIHEMRELLQQAAVVLAIAESKASHDPELLDFLKGGERAIADVGILMAAHLEPLMNGCR